MFEIQRYAQPQQTLWNRFVSTSKNGTFLFDRSYMDYHAGRFSDHSLLFYQGGTLVAVLPANEREHTFYSHQGLTYGGLVMDTRLTAADTVTLFEELNTYLRQHDFHRVVYKQVPWIYHRCPSEEDRYAIFRTCQARLTACDIASVISLEHPVGWRRDRRYGANKAQTDGLRVGLSDDLPAFWHILEQNLRERYGARPVHTVEEMALLKSRFPDNILLYMAWLGDEPLGGTLLYLNGPTLHAQYISATPRGKHLHAVDALYRQIIEHDFRHLRYIDFGKSTEEQGHVLNTSLIYQKEGFGGRGVCYEWWEWEP